MMKLLRKYLEKPARFDLIEKFMSLNRAKILDVGCGNHSAAKTKKYYPGCRYYGLDMNRRYNNNDQDFKLMERFYEIDLEKIGKGGMIEEKDFDCAILNHVIEHLDNGEEAISAICKKIRKGGIIYLEFPSEKSLDLPSMRGTLNFYDDSSHKRLYTLREVKYLLEKNGMRTIEAGRRISAKRIVLLPIYALGSIMENGFVSGSVLWDLLGFANYVMAERVKNGRA